MPAKTFTIHLRPCSENTPGDGPIIEAIRAHLIESGEIPNCTRSDAIRWALHQVSADETPVFEYLPEWWQIYRRHKLYEMGFGEIMEPTYLEHDPLGRKKG